MWAEKMNSQRPKETNTRIYQSCVFDTWIYNCPHLHAYHNHVAVWCHKHLINTCFYSVNFAKQNSIFPVFVYIFLKHASPTRILLGKAATERMNGNVNFPPQNVWHIASLWLYIDCVRYINQHSLTCEYFTVTSCTMSNFWMRRNEQMS